MRIIKILLYVGFAIFISSCISGDGKTTPAVNDQIVGVAATGKALYENKLCYACHGNDALGGPSGIIAQGKTAAEIVQTMAIQIVHSGIVLDEQGAHDIAAFLEAPAGVVPPPTADFSQPEDCAICHPRQYKELMPFDPAT